MNPALPYLILLWLIGLAAAIGMETWLYHRRTSDVKTHPQIQADKDRQVRLLVYSLLVLLLVTVSLGLLVASWFAGALA